MGNENAKILMLVEGEKTDVKLMKHLLSIYGIDQSHTIVSYKTNIYDLYKHMFVEANPEDMDILQLLKERETDPKCKDIFDEHYSDILLIFDLDPQDPRFSQEKITCMVDYFVESSDMGKLYINYPMVEAFYHMESIPDENYNSYTVTKQELLSHEYKKQVTAINYRRTGKFVSDKTKCNIVIRQNISKAWFIINEQNMCSIQSCSTDIITNINMIFFKVLNSICISVGLCFFLLVSLSS